MSGVADEFFVQLEVTSDWLTSMPIQRFSQSRMAQVIPAMRVIAQRVVDVQVLIDPDAYDGAHPVVPAVDDSAVGAQLRVIGAELFMTLKQHPNDGRHDGVLAAIADDLRTLRKAAS